MINMEIIKKIGLGLFFIALLLFTACLHLSKFQINNDLSIDNEVHKTTIVSAAKQSGLLDSDPQSIWTFAPNLRSTIKDAQATIQKEVNAKGLPDDVAEWDYKIGDWKIKEYISSIVTASAVGPIAKSPWLWFFLTFGLGIIGGLLYILPSFATLPGIKNDHVYQRSFQRGLRLVPRAAILSLTIGGLLGYGIIYMGGSWIWSALTAVAGAIILYFVMIQQDSAKHQPARSASPGITGWFGIFTGLYLIGFYILLYWAPSYIQGWIQLVNPISEGLSGGPASQWFLYGFMYTIIVIVMGIRMIAKYRHNTYQMIRTGSVMFFQTAFAFLIPEIMVKLNQPYYDFKNIWPLNYTFFFDWNLQRLLDSGGLGIFMLVWGIALIVIAVPVITYFFGKRWYCSWVCGCGGLAETMGDPYRQLSDKSLRAWKIERFTIHAVLVFAVVMTVLVLISYFSGSAKLGFLNSEQVRTWYGFLIGSAFAGVVGTGFYPLMGNRMWCRFGCPLAAYLGLVQKFKSRFRITVNGGQCISCGNCSTYCEMGIDVRHYAQRGQDIVRSSCVGCGVCSAVCPRGVLRLENASSDISTRTSELRTIHIGEDEVTMLS